ncbi:MAG: TraC family protein [Bacteriovoracia bacterium]
MNKDLLKLPKPINDALSKKDIFIKALFDRPESLSALLPYEEYIPDSGIFRQKDGSLGAVFEVDLLEHEPMTIEHVIAQVDDLKSWFNLPTNCVLQVLYDQAAISTLDPVFSQMKNYYPDGNAVSKLLFEKRLNKLQSACNSDDPLSPMVRRAFVSIRYFPSYSSGRSAKNLLKRGEAVLFKELKEFIQESRNFSQLITNFQHNSRIPLRQLNAAELLDVLRRFFNPKTYYKRSFAAFNPNLSIADQLIYNNPTLDYGGISREGIKTRTLTLKTSPQFAFAGGMAYFTQLKFPFKLSLNFKFPTKKQVKTFFDLKEFFLQNTPSAKAKRQREEILEVQDKLARDDRCLHLTFTVTIEGTSDSELEARVRDVVNVFHNGLECETILEDDIGLGLCLNSLPLNYAPESDHSSQRYIRILRSDATKFLPVFDSFKGLKKPLQLYLSRENNLVRFNLLENETSNHTVVLADSGSGKSAFIIDCIQAAKRMSPEPMVFVIDKKSSYIMASEYFDADLTVFDKNGEMPFTPFRGAFDEAKVEFLTQLLMAGIKLTSPSFEIESTHTSAISKALKLAYAKKVNQLGLTYIEGQLLKQADDNEVEVSMEDFIAELAALTAEKDFEKLGSTIENLLHMLMPFYGDGVYAKYFRGTKNRNNGSKKSIFIYDLDSLDTDPTLQALMTMAVFEEVRRIRRLPENQGRTAFVVLEELGMLGRNNPTAGPFIVDFAETSRKLDMWLISLTPRPQNYFELEAGRAMWSVADNFLFLQMSADNVDYLAKQSALLDEANKEIIKSLRTKRGQFAEVFFMNKKKSRQGAFRYFQTELDRWLAPTNAKDAREAMRALKRFAGQKWQALEYLAKTFPNGVESTIDQQTKPNPEGA